MTIHNVSALAYSYRNEPTLVLQGETLAMDAWTWKRFNFFSKFIPPEYKVNDTYSMAELEYHIDNARYHLNIALMAYGLKLVESGGNIYLSKI